MIASIYAPCYAIPHVSHGTCSTASPPWPAVSPRLLSLLLRSVSSLLSLPPPSRYGWSSLPALSSSAKSVSCCHVQHFRNITFIVTIIACFPIISSDNRYSSHVIYKQSFMVKITTSSSAHECWFCINFLQMKIKSCLIRTRYNRYNRISVQSLVLWSKVNTIS